MKFVYSADGEMVGFTYQNKAYYYIKNVQGDVMAIADDYGTIIAYYMYDAWGNPTPCDDCGDPTTDADNIAVINPIRYRGYYYDSETGLYYLQSRYYNPEWGRFINADGYVSGNGASVQGYNLFQYSFNNPINMSDETGNWPKWMKKAANTIKKAVKKVANIVSNSVKSIKSSFSFVNHVNKTHVTTPTAMLDFGTLFGKVGFSSTITTQSKEPGLIHSYADIGNNASKYAVGVNVVGLLGLNVGVSSETNIFLSAQVTPWLHGEVSVGFDGIGAVVGFDVDNISYDFEIKGGLGLIAIFLAPQIVVFAAQRGNVVAY